MSVNEGTIKGLSQSDYLKFSTLGYIDYKAFEEKLILVDDTFTTFSGKTLSYMKGIFNERHMLIEDNAGLSGSEFNTILGELADKYGDFVFKEFIDNTPNTNDNPFGTGFAVTTFKHLGLVRMCSLYDKCLWFRWFRLYQIRHLLGLMIY